ncbi:MAG: LpqB family beta-propeller domain-containing protein, partial [Nocardioidaceae bacterium]
TPLFAIRSDRLVVLQDGDVHPYAQAPATEPEQIGDFGVDADMERIVTVNESRTRAYIGRLDESGRRTAVVGKNLLAPAWDSLGWVWLTDARTESTSIAVASEQQTQSIPIGPLAGMETRSISISPDGSRFAAIATEVGSKHPDEDAAVYVGLIRRAEDGVLPREVTDVHSVPLSGSDLHAPTSIAWRDATNLVVLARQGTLNPQPYIVSIDGSSVSGGIDVGQPSLPDIGANSVVASGRISDPIYIGDDDGGLWQLDSNQRWSSITDTKVWTPHFPG